MSSRHTLAALIQAFFLEFLVARRGLSSNTLTAYRDGIKLLLNFTAEQRNIPVDKLAVEDFDDRTVVDFLAYLQSARGNTTRSRNTRLAPIHGRSATSPGRSPRPWRAANRSVPFHSRKLPIGPWNTLKTPRWVRCSVAFN
jgi:hypothetical protein